MRLNAFLVRKKRELLKAEAEARGLAYRRHVAKPATTKVDPVTPELVRERAAVIRWCNRWEPLAVIVDRHQRAAG